MSVSEEELNFYMSFPRYHCWYAPAYDLTRRYDGCILHVIFSMYDDVSHAWMMRFIARFYRSCCIVQDHDGEIPLHIAVRENVDPHYIRMMILMSPPGITLLFGHKTKCNPAGLSMDICNPKDKLVCHAVTDLLHIDDKVVAQNEKYAKIVRARNKCRSIARIFIRRRLVAKNRDVSWLVALEIWASRTDDIWEE